MLLLTHPITIHSQPNILNKQRGGPDRAMPDPPRFAVRPADGLTVSLLPDFMAVLAVICCYFAITEKIRCAMGASLWEGRTY